MVLKTLKPRLASLDISRVRTLDTKAGATERIRGSAWMRVRHAVLLRDGYCCCDCGRIHVSNQIDHEIPLEQGGSAMDQSNLKVRCVECHKLKSAAEGRTRHGKG